MISVVVEGASDVEAAKAVAQAAGHSVSRVRIARGKSRFDSLVAKYNAAASHESWVMFRDSDGVCPRDLANRLKPSAEQWNDRFRLRIAHTMTEAWLLADPTAFAHFFSVPVAKVPVNPEVRPHAKRDLLSLCAMSRSRRIKSAMLAGSGEIGPLYVSMLNEFASTSWRPIVAAEVSESLRRALVRIRELPGADLS